MGMVDPERTRLPFLRAYRIAFLKRRDGPEDAPQPRAWQGLPALLLALRWRNDGVPNEDITWYERRNFNDVDVQHLKFMDPDLHDLDPGESSPEHPGR